LGSEQSFLRIVAEAVGSDGGGGVESEHAAKAPITTARIPDLIKRVSFPSRQRRCALHGRLTMQGLTRILGFHPGDCKAIGIARFG
jgi:hypothetical protein